MRTGIRLWAALMAGTWAGGAMRAGAAEPAADLVLSNGVVLTLDPARPRASAVAVRAGRVVAVGDAASVRPLLGASTRRIDLEGRTVLPGLIDAHVHVEGIGTARESLDLVGAQSLEEATRRVAERARTLAPGEWLLGRGWDQNDWPEKRFPTAADLDAAAGERPVYLVRVDGHAAWANAKALALAGLGASTADPPGGRLMRDAAGAPTGVLIDSAQALVARVIPPPTREMRKRRLIKGLEACAEAGLTSVHDAGVSLDTIPLYREVMAEEKAPVRVYVMLRGPDEFLERGGSLRPEVAVDGRLTIRAIKVVADGALGSRGALLLEPYADEPAAKGLMTVDAGSFGRLLRQALAQGFQVNTHAIGDAANRLVLDAYAQAFGPEGGARHRFRVEHAQVLAAADVPRFKALGVVPSMQPTHCTSDMYWAGERLGPERVKGAYLWRTFLRQGVPVAGGSDAPVEKVAVVPGIHAAVTRQDAKGWPQSGWHPGESVTPLEAIEMFSRHAAFAAFEEREYGTIATGRRADFTVLSLDPTQVSPQQILAAEVTLTIVGGRVAFQR